MQRDTCILACKWSLFLNTDTSVKETKKALAAWPRVWCRRLCSYQVMDIYISNMICTFGVLLLSLPSSSLLMRLKLYAAYPPLYPLKEHYHYNSTATLQHHRNIVTSSVNMSSYSSDYTSGSGGSWSSSSYQSGTYSPPSSAGSNSTRCSESTTTRSRLNHNNQIVSVINHGQKGSDASEPRPEYRDASCYYSRSA